MVFGDAACVVLRRQRGSRVWRRLTGTMKMVEMLIDACEDGSVSKQEKSKLKADWV